MRSVLTENIVFPLFVMAHVRAAKVNETVCVCLCVRTHVLDDSVFKQRLSGSI